MLALLEGRVRRRVTFAKAALDLLGGYPFPGNVRELWNLVERLAVSSSSGLVDVPDLPGDVVRAAMARAVPEQTTNLRDFVRKVEAAIVREAVDRYGSQTKAARQLGIAQATVARKARRPGTPAPAF
jgi:transcriptional regulator with PAS, ATPase and Fis domain